MAWLTALTLLVTTPVFVAPAVATTASKVQLTETEQAQQNAAASGDPVEVVSERTERETVFANPDGKTFTLNKSIVPVRVETPGGGWAEPDARLEKRADGSIGPKATAVDLSFSPGGAGEGLVTIGEDGQSVSLGWPGTLPPPRLEGERAVYENVLPDVNLILTATVEGFRQVLEVETLEAASDPALASLEYSMKTEGLRIREGAAGTMDALDGNGQVVFRSPSARMWNSAGETPGSAAGEGLSAQAAAVRPIASAAQNSTSQNAEQTPAGPAEEGDPLAGPGVGDESALMEVDVAADTVTVTPDTELIAGTTSAELPLYIDPSVELGEGERTVLSSDGDSFYNFSGGDNGMSVGRCGSAVIGGVRYYCTSGSEYVNRMYFEFTPGRLKGKHVLDATFTVTETWSFSCDARWIDLERTNEITKTSKWPGPRGTNPNKTWDQMVDVNVSAGRGSACSPSQPRAGIEFNDNPAEADENLTPTVRSFADGKIAKLTLMLMAKNENDPISWKRFDDDATLKVTYVGKPAIPTEYGLSAGASQICSTSETKPTMWSYPQPTFAATPQTAPGGEGGALLRVYFDLDVKVDADTWSDAASPSTGHEKPTSGYAGDGVDQDKLWNTTLADGKQYRVRSWTRSYINFNNEISSIGSGATRWCYFTVDSKAPKPPSIVFNSTYSACVKGGACEPKGGANQPGTVTFGPAAGSGDVNVSYSYKLSTDSEWKHPTGATVTTSITPMDSGTVTLTVIARDAAGRTGENKVRFLVGEGDAPMGRWTFNEASGAAVDVSATAPVLRDDATLTGAVRTTNGRRGVVTEGNATGDDRALKLANQAYASTAGKILETQGSYTVAAWVRLESTGSNAYILGQDGTQNSPFYLGYCEGVRTWCLRLSDADSTTTSIDNQRVNALQPAATKVWTHLAAAINTNQKKLILYVNGVEQGRDDLTTGSWSSTGALQIGRVKWKGGYVDHFRGEVDEVAVWQREAKAPSVVAEEANPKGADGNAYVELVAHYVPDGVDDGGTSLPDLTEYGNSLGLSEGASLDGKALVLNGTSGSATVSRPLIDDTGSFTVDTEVAVDTESLAGKPIGHRAQVLGQRTASGSSWSLWLEKTGTKEVPELDAEGNPVLDDSGEPLTHSVPVAKWHFGRLTADGSGTSVVSDPAELEDQVLLVGVYDTRTQQITLYVGSTPQGDPLEYTAAAGTGEFAVGKGWTNSAWGHYLTGSITEIRLWAGAATDSDQVQTLTSS
ncbi:LamG domain-containing protein [Streptomyces sp. NPDC047042]|uniref:LamG domain-containing protein n=1 Tax=Streptomyces sp. NPDC047042 TaxID=3154807 RepID=UPI0034019C5C